MRCWLLTLLLLPGYAAATTYKCVDEYGRTVYAAKPCGSNAKVVNLIDNHADAPDDAGGASASKKSYVPGGMLVLHLDAHHSYRTVGTVNGSSVNFVVDTGASGTAISQRVADAAGIRSCDKTGYSATANGVVRRCTAIASQITFGAFNVRDLPVAILPNLPVDALLGMDILGGMKIRQEDGVLYISGR